MKLSNLKNSLVEVFSNYKYSILTISITIIFILFNLLINNYKYLFNNFSLETIYLLSLTGLNSITKESLVNLVIVSILTGILFSMVVYKIKSIPKTESKKTGTFGTLGVILGTLAPACSACGFGILALLGYGTLLAALPFAGLEIAWLSIIILIIAIFIISNQIAKKVCD